MSRPDFEQSVGETFGDFICPPVPFEDASAHECCEVIKEVFGDGVSSENFASVDDEDIFRLAAAFGRYFDVEPPSAEQVRNAVRQIAKRWPPGSLHES